jgi:hypothetical protein
MNPIDSLNLVIKELQELVVFLQQKPVISQEHTHLETRIDHGNTYTVQVEDNVA